MIFTSTMDNPEHPNPTPSADCCDYTAWLEWAAKSRHRNRQSRCGDLMDDSDVDPAVEDHMSMYINSKKAPPAATSTSTSTSTSTTKTTFSPVHRCPIQHDKRCRSPRNVTLKQQMQQLQQQCYIETAPRRSMRMASSMSLANHQGVVEPQQQHNHHSNNNHPNSSTISSSSSDCSKRSRTTTMELQQQHNNNWQDWCFASYPNAQDVEKALEGCGVSQVMAPWVNETTKQQQNEPHEYEAAAAEQGPNDVHDVERAFEECRVTSGSLWKQTKDSEHQQQQQRSSAALRPKSSPASSFRAAPVPAEQAPPLLRVTTSAIVGVQNAIWDKIQLERQGNIVPQQHQKTTTPNNNNNNKNHPRGSCNRGSSTWNINNGTNYKNEATRNQTQAMPPLSPIFNTGAAVRSRERSSSRANTVVHARAKAPGSTYAHRAAASNTKSPSSATTTTSRGESYTPPEFVATILQDAHNLRAATTSATTTATALAVAVATVPCLGCQAPLKLAVAAQKNATTVVYCSGCGTMASAELMRSLIPKS